VGTPISEPPWTTAATSNRRRQECRDCHGGELPAPSGPPSRAVAYRLDDANAAKSREVQPISMAHALRFYRPQPIPARRDTSDQQRRCRASPSRVNQPDGSDFLCCDQRRHDIHRVVYSARHYSVDSYYFGVVYDQLAPRSRTASAAAAVYCMARAPCGDVSGRKLLGHVVIGPHGYPPSVSMTAPANGASLSGSVAIWPPRRTISPSRGAVQARWRQRVRRCRQSVTWTPRRPAMPRTR
jgi:hypothetical protein